MATKKSTTAKKGSTKKVIKKASVTTAKAVNDEKGFKPLTIADFRHDLEYYTKDRRGNINPAPNKLKGHLGQDAVEFHAAVYGSGAYAKTKATAAPKKKAVKKEEYKSQVGKTTSVEGDATTGKETFGEDQQ